MFLLNNNILESNIINVCIIVLALVKLWPHSIAPMLNERHKNIFQQIQENEKKLQQAAINLMAAENQTSTLKENLDKIQNDSEKTIKSLEKNALNQGKQKIREVTYKGKKRIYEEISATKNQIYQYAAALAVEASTKKLRETLTYEKQAELIDKNINQLDNLK